jgi:beta-1,4-mannosyl-glycoprotein beta-1,4-N-acetylglucosaminyltransferase
MIIDSFLFLNELELLEKRLEYLYDTVDLFVIVEADHTFAGNQKKLNFLDNIERYQKYLDKILYCPMFIDMSKYKVWEHHVNEWSFRVEIDQRKYITKILNRFPSDTTIILGDVDEIPLKFAIPNALNWLLTQNFDVVVLKCDMFYYNFNQKQVIPWWGPIVCANSYIQRVGAQWARSSRVYNAAIENAGYHLGYWGDPNNIKYKIENFAHQEYNINEYTDITKIQERINQGRDIFGRDTGQNTLITIDQSTIDQEIYRIFSPIAGK